MKCFRLPAAFALCLLFWLPPVAGQIPATLEHSLFPPGNVPQPGTEQGASAAADGTLAVVGAPGDDIGGQDSGVAKIYDTSTGQLLYVLVNPSPAADDRFGAAVAISGTRVVVGASQDDTGSTNAGSVYLYDLASATPTVPMATLNNPSPAEWASFGLSVAISGTRVVAGAPYDSTGALSAGSAYVYDLSSATPTVPVTTLRNPAPANWDFFGWAVGISGTRVVVSAYQDDVVGSFDAGSVYVYDLASATPAVPVATLNKPGPQSDHYFGYAVAVSGSRVVVGASIHSQPGRAYVYDFAGVAPTVPVATLHSPAAANYDFFGQSVAISGTRLVVGSRGDDMGATDAGSAYVYDLASGTPAAPVATLNNPNPATYDTFGSSVAISGTSVLVGAPGDDTAADGGGSAYAYDLSNAAPAVPAATLNTPSPSVNDHFAYSVAVSGTRVVVGTPGARNGPSNGRVYVYDLGSTTPAEPVATLSDPNPDWHVHFGFSVAIDGGRIVVGAPTEFFGWDPMAYVYDLNSATPTVPITALEDPSFGFDSRFGYAVGISGARVVVGNYMDYGGGSAFLYDLASATPATPIAALDNPNPPDPGFFSDARFGYAVSISGTRMLVGAPGDDTGAPAAGRAYVYDLTSGPVLVATLNNPGPAEGDLFGSAVGISGTRVVVGAYGDDTGLTDAGSGYVYDLASATSTVPVATLNNLNPNADDRFGYSVGVSGSRVVVGSYQHDTGAADAGSAYLYDLASATPGVPVAMLNDPDAMAGDYFGFAVAVDGDTIAAGAYLDDTAGSDRGAAYIFNGSPAPEIVVEQPAGTSLRDGAAIVDFGTVAPGNTGARTFTIKNRGEVDLTGLGITIDGANASDFTVIASPGAPVSGPGGSTTFTVRFSPGAAGLRSAALHIASNDADEGSFDIVLSGSTIPHPDITIEQPAGNSLSDGVDRVEVGSVVVGSARDLAFVIRNPGDANLTGLGITIDGANAGDFSVTANPAVPVSGPGGVTSFTVRFAPGAVGVRSAALHVSSNDADENPVDIALTAWGLHPPDIAVEQPAGTNLVDGGATVDFGHSLVAGGVNLMFTIANTGHSYLTGLAILIDGANASDFTVTASPSTTVSGPSGRTAFNIRFSPAAAGTRSAVVHILSNDPDESPFDIAVTGTGLTPVQFAEQAYLKASNTGGAINGSFFGDYFGASVSLSGNTMVVGAPYESSNATGVNGNETNNAAGFSGAAYVFVRSGTTWVQEAYLKASNTGATDGFGRSVAVSGDTLVIGAPFEASSATGVNGNQNNENAYSSGAAYVFVRNGTTWSQQAYLKASNTGQDDRFGFAVAISGGTVVVGALGERSSATGVNGNQGDNSAVYAGAAYVFVRSGTTWSQQAYLKASNTAQSGEGDSFGYAVAVSGETVIVGAPYEDSSATGVNGNQSDDSAGAAGAAYIFVRNGTAWSQQAYLKASDTDTFDSFGLSVAVSGDTVVVGSPYAFFSYGAAYVFVRSGITWSQEGYLKASNFASEDRFGESVAVSGDVVVAGAPGEDSGATGVNGNQNNEGAAASGAAYVFVRNGTAWTQHAYLKASNTGTVDLFGSSIAVSGYTVLAGAVEESSNATGVNGNGSDNSATRSGAAYIFTGMGVPTRPEIEAEQPAGTSLTDGSSAVDFGTVAPGSIRDLTFIIKNIGEANLTGLGISIDGTNLNDFTVTVPPTAPVGSPGSASFTVRFSPGAIGDRSAVLHIASNDADENPFDVALIGSTLAPPGIVVEQPAGTNLVDGSATASFGRGLVGASTDLTFTIKNTGEASLTGLGIVIDGNNPADFSVVANPTAPVSGPHGSTTFTIRFTPPKNGLRSAMLHLASNDPDENPFDIVLTGEGVGHLQIAQQAYLKASNTNIQDVFGVAVAVSGDTVVVGTPFEDSSATGVNGSQSNNSAVDSGAVYVFVRNGTTWTQQAYLKASNTGPFDSFGVSVALSGDTLVVGASGEDSNATGINGNQTNNNASEAGAAYVFVRNGTTWTQQAYLKASNSGAGDFFGISVAVSGNTVIVGAYLEDSNATGVNGNQFNNSAVDSGAACIFVRNGTTWTQQAYLKASNTGASDSFGYWVGAAGDTVVVGATFEDSNAAGVNGNQSDNSAQDSGAAYVFVRSGTTWSQQAYLKASNPGAGDQFNVVAISDDTIVVAAPLEDSNATGVNGIQSDDSGTDSGAAYVFVRSGTSWNQQAYLKASNTGHSDSFGIAAAVSGDTVLVTAQGESSNAIGVNGDQSDNSAPSAGAAYAFVRTGTTWSQQVYLKASNTDPGDHFGYSVGISGTTVVLGAHGERSFATGVNGNQSDNSAAQAGAAYIFTGFGLLTPFQQWKLTHLGDANAPDLGDADGDGLTNVVEFAFGLNPTRPDTSALPRFQRSGVEYVLSFAAPGGVSGITYGAEWSHTMMPGSWTAIPDTGSDGQHTFRLPITGPRQFLRLKVTAP